MIVHLAGAFVGGEDDDRMTARGVFIGMDDGRYYMEEDAARRFVKLRRQRMLVFLAAAAILLFLVWMICR